MRMWQNYHTPCRDCTPDGANPSYWSGLIGLERVLSKGYES